MAFREWFGDPLNTTTTPRCEEAELPSTGELRDAYRTIARFPAQEHIVSAFPLLGVSLAASPNTAALHSPVDASAASFDPVCPAGFQENTHPWFEDDSKSAFWEQPGSQCAVSCPNWVYTTAELRTIAGMKCALSMLSVASLALILYAWINFSKPDPNLVLTAKWAMLLDGTGFVYGLLVLVEPALLCAGGSATPGVTMTWGNGSRAALPFAYLAWYDFLRSHIIFYAFVIQCALMALDFSMKLIWTNKKDRKWTNRFMTGIIFYFYVVNYGLIFMFSKFWPFEYTNQDVSHKVSSWFPRLLKSSPFHQSNLDFFGYNPLYPLSTNQGGWSAGYPADMQLYHHNRGSDDLTGGFSERMYAHFIYLYLRMWDEVVNEEIVFYFFLFWVIWKVHKVTSSVKSASSAMGDSGRLRLDFLRLVGSFAPFLVIVITVKNTVMMISGPLPNSLRADAVLIPRNIATHMWCVFEAVRAGLDAGAECAAGPDVSSRVPVWWLCTFAVFPQCLGIFFIPIFGFKRKIVAGYVKQFPNFSKMFCGCLMSHYNLAYQHLVTMTTTVAGFSGASSATSGRSWSRPWMWGSSAGSSAASSVGSSSVGFVSSISAGDGKGSVAMQEVIAEDAEDAMPMGVE